MSGGDFTPVTALLAHRARHHPDARPLCVDGTGWLDFGTWDARSDAVARGLLARGLRRGDRVALFFNGLDWIDYSVAYFGVLKAGGTATHLCDLLGPDELTRRLRHAEPVGTVHGTGSGPTGVPAGATGWTATTGEIAVPDGDPPGVVLGPQDCCDILYTSGTTGPAKALLNPHGNVSSGRNWSALAEDIFDPDRPLLCPLPLGTAYSASTAGAFAVASRAPVIVSDPDDVERMGALVERHRVASLMIRPRAAAELVQRRLGERHDLSSVSVIGIASGALAPRVARGLLAMMPAATITTAYGGGAEAVPAHVRANYDPDRPRCLGRAQAGTDLAVTDDAGLPVSPGTLGEIRVRTAAPRRRYLDPEAEARVFVDGWVRTGDVGHLTGDGELVFFDRGEDVVRTTAGPVSSIVVENALMEHPAVLEAAVVGLPGDNGDEQVVAAVRLAPTHATPTPDLRVTTAPLPPPQRPVEVHVLAALPRDPISDKVLKTRLREHLRRTRSAGTTPTSPPHH
ncbi:MAG TPA: class I adenylate-forming enzyme family protein [Kineosporiaceae bacterium]